MLPNVGVPQKHYLLGCGVLFYILNVPVNWSLINMNTAESCYNENHGTHKNFAEADSFLLNRAGKLTDRARSFVNINFSKISELWFFATIKSATWHDFHGTLEIS